MHVRTYLACFSQTNAATTFAHAISNHLFQWKKMKMVKGIDKEKIKKKKQCLANSVAGRKSYQLELIYTKTMDICSVFGECTLFLLRHSSPPKRTTRALAHQQRAKWFENPLRQQNANAPQFSIPIPNSGPQSRPVLSAEVIKRGFFTWAQDIICCKISSVELPSWQDRDLCIVQW